MGKAQRHCTDGCIELRAEVVIRIRQVDLASLFDVSPREQAPVLNRAERRVVCALFECGKLSGPQLAQKTGYRYGPYLRGTLAGLKRRELICNRSGYQLTALGRSLCSDICQELAPDFVEG